MIRRSHPLRALVAAMGAFLLAFTPLAARAADEVIHPGDQLSISVYGDQSLSQTAVVQPDGTIQYPLVGRVFVLGQTASQARDTLAFGLRKFVKHPIVTVAVQQQGQINVLVLGNVKNPGKYQVRSGSRLSDAIAAAAGVAQLNGDYPTARVSERDGSLATASLQKLLRDGDASQNLPLDDNAIVYVTGADSIRVQILGAVTRPGNVEVNQGDRLSMAVARAGAESAAKPDLNHVYLTRLDPAQNKTVTYQVDMYQALLRGDQRFDPILQKDDKIYIPETRQINAASIGILGLLGRVLRL